jgi:hypothetical protein
MRWWGAIECVNKHSGAKQSEKYSKLFKDATK